MEQKEAENFPELMKKFLEFLESRNKIVLHKQKKIMVKLQISKVKKYF